MKMPTYKLTYFDIPARAETARMLFSLLGQEFEDIRIDRKDWPKIKPTTPFGQVPVLQVDDFTICQSHAINRFLARKFGYAGKTELEMAQVDMAAACIEECVQVIRPVRFESDEAIKDQLRKDLFEPLMDKLGKLEALAASNPTGSGWFVGSEMTWADINLLTRCEFLTRNKVDVDWSKFPKLTAIKDRVTKQPAIAAWIAKTQKKPTYKLTYFDMKGRAEVSRLLFALADQPFEDVRIKREDWPKMKNDTPFGQEPTLEVNGTVMCQSNACHRYLARQYGYAGKSDMEEAYADMLVDCIEDYIRTAVIPIFRAKSDDEKKQALQKCQDELMPAFLEKMEKFLCKNKSGDGFFVGNGLTWADLSFYTIVDGMSDYSEKPDLTKVPKLKALMDKVSALPKIAAWNAKCAKK